MIAVSHPGKIGDALYALPTVKKLCEINNTNADFYTSSYCGGLRRLIEYQPYINKFIVSENYKITRMDMGVQPWQMPISGEYSKIYHLGFQNIPDRPLPEFIARNAGLDSIEKLSLYHPDFETLDDSYIVIAPRSDYDFTPAYIDFIQKSPFPCVIVGAKHEYIGYGIDKTGLDFLESTTWISKAIGFLGISSMFVLADAFDYPKVVFHRGLDLRHLTHNNTKYLTSYNFKDTLRSLSLMNTFSKTMQVNEDYKDLGGYVQHFSNLLDHFKTVGFSLFRFEHEHRKWEYGLVYKLADMVKAKKILDVGGGGSLLAVGLAWVGMKVTEVDPGEVGSWIDAQNKTVGNEIKFYQKDLFEFDTEERYDMVASTSVIEHLPNDHEFIKKLASFVKPNGLLVLTFDFHPDGVQKVSGHIRTYNKESVEEILKMLKPMGFKLYGGEVDYDHFTPDVNGCTFASLVVRKAK